MMFNSLVGAENKYNDLLHPCLNHYNSNLKIAVIVKHLFIDQKYTVRRKLGTEKFFVHSYLDLELCYKQSLYIMKTSIEKIRMLLRADLEIWVLVYKIFVSP